MGYTAHYTHSDSSGKTSVWTNPYENIWESKNSINGIVNVVCANDLISSWQCMVTDTILKKTMTNFLVTTLMSGTTLAYVVRVMSLDYLCILIFWCDSKLRLTSESLPSAVSCADVWAFCTVRNYYHTCPCAYQWFQGCACKVCETHRLKVKWQKCTG